MEIFDFCPRTAKERAHFTRWKEITIGGRILWLAIYSPCGLPQTRNIRTNKYLHENTGIGTHTRLSGPEAGSLMMVARPSTHVPAARTCCARAWLMCAAAAALQCHWHHTAHTSFHEAEARSLTKKKPTGSCPPTDRTLHARTIIAPARQPAVCDVRCSREKYPPFLSLTSLRFPIERRR